MYKNILGLLVFMAWSACGIAARASSLSYSTDFDGTGTGTGFRLNVPHESSSQGPSYSRSNPGPGDSDSSVVRPSYLRQTYEQQVAEAKKRAQEEALRQEIERLRRQGNVTELQRLLQELQELERDEASLIQRMQYQQMVIDLERPLAQARAAHLATLPSYAEQLNWALNHAVVPPPEHPRHFNRILLWGTQSTPDEALKAVQEGITDPFTGEKFDDVFAFGTGGLIDWSRSSIDHLLGQINRLSPETLSHLRDLQGASVDELVCHSNGCRVAQVLIATGQLKVKKLRILGGDNVIFELSNWKALQEKKQLEEVSIYVTRGDIIPADSLGIWKIIDLISKIGRPLESLAKMANDPTYQLLGLVPRDNYNPDSAFQFHFVSYPASGAINPREKHIYENYARIIKGWRMTQCLNSDGTTNRRCILY